MDDDDDFTFPTVVVATARGPTTVPESQLGRDQDTAPHLLLQLPALPDLVAADTPLWPFAGSVPKTTTTTAPPPSSASPPPVTADDEEEQAPVPVSGGGARTQRSAVAVEGHRVAADEDTMDLLWEDTPTNTTSIATAPAPESSRSSVAGEHAGPPPPTKQRAASGDVDDDGKRAAALADAERMDKLWESFNEDLIVLRHQHRDRARRSRSAADFPAGSSRVVPRAAAGGLLDDDPADDDRWYLCNYSPSSGGADDDESDQETSASASASSPAEQRRGYGCAPTMLRASSRAGGAGQFCAASSPRGRRRRGHGAAAGWALLLRLFRRLFAVDKTVPSSSRSHSSLYVP